MKTFALSFLGGLAALVLFFIVLPLVLLMTFMPKEPPAKKNIVIELDLRAGMSDQPNVEGLQALVGGGPSFIEVLLKLNSAVTDPNVKGVYIRAAEMDMGSSRAEELRAAIKRLRAGGKFVIVHSQGFFASGPSAYRAVSAADEIWMQPGASFEAPGIAFETLFFGKAFEKFKLKADMEQFYEYKNAVDTFTQSKYTGPHAEAMTRLAQSVWTDSLNDIAEDRKDKLAEAAKAAMGATPGQGQLAKRIAADNQFSSYIGQAGPLMEHSPYSTDEAVALGLVDKSGWPEDVADAAKARAGGDIVPISQYQPGAKRGQSKGVIAIVGGEGDIVNGSGGSPDLLSLSAPTFASDAVAKKLLALADDSSVKAVIFRIDSGGGSATASEQIWRAVERLKAKGKKVVVSMGSMAASGGYYVAANADRIVSTKATITGSIGVFGGKFAVADALAEFGITSDTVKVGGEFTTAYSMQKMTDGQRKLLHSELEGVYDLFIQRVDEGRGKLDNTQVREIAKGRIWSGADAQLNGLVDTNGDFIVAINTAKELIGLKPEDRVEIRLPQRKATPFDFLIGMAAQGANASAQQKALAQALVAAVGDRRAAILQSQIRRLSTDNGVQLWTPSVMER